jgi:hypothetical protein
MLALVGLARATDNQEDLKRRFLEEAPRDWERYLEWSKKLQGHCEITVTDLESNQVLEKLRYEWKQSSNCALFMEQFLGPTDFSGLVYVKNSQ